MSIVSSRNSIILALFAAFLGVIFPACHKEKPAESLEMQRYAVPDQGLEIFYPATWSQRYEERQVIFYPSAEQNNPLSPNVALEVVS